MSKGRRAWRATVVFVIGALFGTASSADILISNIGSNYLADTTASVYTPMVNVDAETHVSFAQQVGLSGTAHYTVTSVIVPMYFDQRGSNTIVAAIWNGTNAPGSAPQPGAPIPNQPIRYLGSRTIATDAPAAFTQRFTGFPPFDMAPGDLFWVVITLTENDPLSATWGGINRHTDFTYTEIGPGGLYYRAARNYGSPSPGNEFPTFQAGPWSDSSLSIVAPIAVEGFPSPHLSLRIRADLRAELQIDGPANQNVTVEMTDSLPGVWQTLTTATLINGTATVVERGTIQTGPRFYRVR